MCKSEKLVWKVFYNFETETVYKHKKNNLEYIKMKYGTLQVLHEQTLFTTKKQKKTLCFRISTMFFSWVDVAETALKNGVPPLSYSKNTTAPSDVKQSAKNGVKLFGGR